MKAVLRSTLFCTLLALLGANATAQNSKKTDSEDSGEKVYDRTLRSAVWILVPVGGGKARSGSGALIDAGRGLILTNYHVVRDDDRVLVHFPIYTNGKPVAERKAYSPNRSVPAKVLAREPRRDLAIIQLERPVPPEAKALKLAKDSPKPGSRVHSIGNPSASGALWVYTEGSVRQVYSKKFLSKGRDGEAPFEVDARIVETQSPVNAGDSGGPVVNDKGELVAIVEGHLEDSQARAVSMFIDVSEVRDLLVSKHLSKITVAKETEKPKDVQPTSDQEKVKTEEDTTAKKERDAARQLKYVKEFVAAGKTDLARDHCHDIIDKFPGTKAAKEAKDLLEKLKE
jgi:S1-C subfamily serine protease